MDDTPTPPTAAGPADPGLIRQAMAAIEAQRPTLGPALTELALAPLRQMLEHSAAAQATPQLRRAQVTVLFADIVESTALASRLDAEDVLRIFGGVLQRAAACVRARGGRVLRYTGDGIKAGFGTQGTREDDAAQAVLAGLDILAAGREHAAWVAREYGERGFALRVGAHTGEVALGAGFEDDNTLTGDTVNIAARLEQAAPPGALRISAETWSHVRGVFEVDTPAPLHVKGVPAPLQTYLVQGTRAGPLRRSVRGIEGVPTRMVGRDAELGVLQTAFAQLMTTRGFAAVTVVADAGVGKSRLLDEFDTWRRAQSEHTLALRGHTTPQTEGQVFGLLRDILARHFQIADDDSLEAARGKMERGIVPLFMADDGPDLAQGHAHLLGHLIGIEWRDSPHIKGILDDPRQLRNRALHAAMQLFGRLAEQAHCPVVLALEDLHWADSESLDFLDQLAAASQNVPLLQLAFTRPTLYERHATWGRGSAHPCVNLAPLPAVASQDLAAELLRKLPAVPQALTDLLTGQAEGNPFYMEELVKMLIDRGAILTGDPWRVDTDKLQLARVPSTLTGVLQARLDSLPAPEKRTLQQASVVGTVFWEQVLAAIDAQAPAQLPALARRALALPRTEGAVDGLSEYAFHHQLLQQVTYGTVLKQDRREGHAKVARWMAALAAQGSLRAGDFLGTAAEHFERAGDTRHAAEFHARAAEHAAQRFAHERVLAHAAQSLALLGDEQDTDQGTDQARADLRWRLLVTRENTLFLLARRDEQAADLDAMESLAEQLQDDGRRATTAWRRALRALRMADWAEQERAATQGLACATRAGDDGLRLQALRLLAVAKINQGDAEACRALAQQGLDEARRLKLPGLEARMLNALAIATNARGDLIGSLELHQQCQQALRSTGDRVNEAISLTTVGFGWAMLGDLTRAQRELETALPLLRANGDRVVEANSLSALSTVASWQGDHPRAHTLAQQALDIATAAQARDKEVVAWIALGEAQRALGQAMQAKQSYVRAQTLALEAHCADQISARACLASLALDEGDTDTALVEIQPMLDHLATGGGLSGNSDRLIELTCFQVLARTQDPRAFGYLERAHTALMTQANALTDAALRQGFLQNVGHHREVVAAWAAWHGGTPEPAGL